MYGAPLAILADWTVGCCGSFESHNEGSPLFDLAPVEGSPVFGFAPVFKTLKEEADASVDWVCLYLEAVWVARKLWGSFSGVDSGVVEDVISIVSLISNGGSGPNYIM